MRFSDLISLKKGPEALVRLALCPLVLVIAFQMVVGFLGQLGAGDLLLAFLFLSLLSPVAYLIRERRQGRRQRQGARRGAERTPLLPPTEEDE